MLDGSTSLQAEGFEKARGFVQSLVAYLDISPTAARVAVVQYSGPRKHCQPPRPTRTESSRRREKQCVCTTAPSGSRTVYV